MAHFVEKCGSYLCNRVVEIFGAEVDLPTEFVICDPDLIDTVPAVCALPAVRE